VGNQFLKHFTNSGGWIWNSIIVLDRQELGKIGVLTSVGLAPTYVGQPKC
jgi:hypothetical protein